jgi:aminopeptidase N
LGRYSITTNETAGKADFHISLRVPKRFDAVAVGNKVGEEKEGDYRHTLWESDVPLKVAGFAFGEVKTQIEKVGQTEVQIFANKYPDDSLKAIQNATRGVGDMSVGGEKSTGFSLGSLAPSRLRKVMAAEVGNSLKLMEEFFGPYPYKKLAVSTIPGSYGQGWPSLIYLSTRSFMDSGQLSQFGYKDHVRITDYFRAHETSHQWWGHVVGWKSYHDQWLSEGFANFSGNLYTQFRRNPGEYARLLKRSKRNLISANRYGAVYDKIGPIYAGRRLSSTRAPGGYSVVVYQKGGWVLHMLRMMLSDPRNQQDPDALFKVMMKDFTKTYYNQAASTEDFKAIVEKHMTPSMDLDRNGTMDWFFNSWVYGTGIPTYELEYSLLPAAEQDKFVLTGKITQSGVRPDFKMIVPLYFHMGENKMRAGWINIIAPETPFEVTIGFEPDKVSINDMEEVLAEVKQ